MFRVGGQEKDGTRTTILLGVFDAEKHLAWLEANPNKRPKTATPRKQISHLYTDGSVCDVTGAAPRLFLLRCLTSSATKYGI